MKMALPPVNAGRVTDVRTEERTCANADNPRGSRTFEWRPWEGENGAQREGVHFNNPQITYYWREPHEVCGAHCHQGNNPSDPDRSPEEVFFILGNVKIELEDLWGGTAVLDIDVEPGKPVSVEIPAWVLHTFRVGDRGIHFMETKRNPYSRDSAKQDVCTMDEFYSAQRSTP